MNERDEIPPGWRNVPLATWFACWGIVGAVGVGLVAIANARHISDVIRPGELMIAALLLVIIQQLSRRA